MNAIDQYVAPPPPRPAAQPAPQQRNGSDPSGAQSFGDVYNKASNANDADDNTAPAPREDSGKGQSSQTDAKASGAAGQAQATDPNGKKTATAGSALLALASNPTAKKSGKDDNAAVDPKLNEDALLAAARQDAKNNAAAVDAGKLAQKALEGQAPAADADAAAIALKLLGADVLAKGQDKKLPAETVEKKDGPAKENAGEAKADATGHAADAANALAAAALVVNAAGGQPKDQQEQAKPKSEGQSEKTISATGLSIAGAASNEETKGPAGADAAKPDAVTVLDARRFVGSGEVLSSNTQAVISGVTRDGDWAAAMKAASAAATAPSEPRTATPVNMLKIQMTPESLGNVTATLRLHGDQLTVHLTVESGEAFKQLSHDKDGLIQSLKSQGFSVDQVSVQMAPTPTTDKTVAQTSSGQQSGGQMQDGSSAGQFAQQGREQDNNRRQQNNGFNTTWQNDDKSVAPDPAAHASDAVRTGQVYL